MERDLDELFRRMWLHAEVQAMTKAAVADEQAERKPERGGRGRKSTGGAGAGAGAGADAGGSLGDERVLARRRPRPLARPILRRLPQP